MSEILGKMEKPEAAQFKNERKLFFVPLIITPQEKDPIIAELSTKYWREVTEQLSNLESKLSPIKHVYHELLPASESVKHLEELGINSHSIVKTLITNGAIISAIEDDELMREFIDWNLCLSLHLQSQNVFSKIYDAFQEVVRRRYEYVAKSIDETLRGNESAVLFMREGHSIQFPSDIQIFYVAPPSLDALRRALRERQENYNKHECDNSISHECHEADPSQSEGNTEPLP